MRIGIGGDAGQPDQPDQARQSVQPLQQLPAATYFSNSRKRGLLGGRFSRREKGFFCDPRSTVNRNVEFQT